MDNRVCAIMGDNHEVILVPFTVKERWGYKLPVVADYGTMVDDTKVQLTEAQKLLALHAAGSIVASQPEA